MWHNAGLRFFRPNREADDPNYSPKHMHILLRVFKSVSVTKDSQDTLWPSPGPTAGYHLKAVQSPQLQMTRWIDGHLRNSRCLSTKNVDVIQESTKNKSLTTKVTYSWITWPYYIYIRQDSFFCKPFLRIQDPNKTTTGKTGMDRPCIDFFCQSILQSQTVWKCLKCQDTFAGFL